jgi:hypothetical protein
MTLRAFIDWLRRRRAAKLERDVQASVERERDYASVDGSQGEVHPQHNIGQHP